MMPRTPLVLIALSVALAGFALSCAAAAPAAAPVAAASAAASDTRRTCDARTKPARSRRWS